MTHRQDKNPEFRGEQPEVDQHNITHNGSASTAHSSESPSSNSKPRSTMKNIARAIAMTLGFGAAGTGGYLAATEIPRASGFEHHGYYDNGEQWHDWYQEFGKRTLSGELREGTIRNSVGYDVEGAFTRGEGEYAPLQLQGHGKRIDPQLESSVNKNLLFNSEKAIREEGEFKDDKLHGHGVSQKANGTIIEGEFAYGKPNGQCTITYSDGWKLVGTFQNAKPVTERNPLLDGIQIPVRPNESVSLSFETDFGRRLYGVVHGKLTDDKGKVMLEGEFENRELKNGYGVYGVERIGAKYQGEIKDFKPHGKGSVELDDGRTLTGIFDQGVLPEKNIVLDLEGSFYEGGLKDGKANGEGVQKLSNGTIKSGTFADGVLRHGKITGKENFHRESTVIEGDFNEEEKIVTGHISFAREQEQIAEVAPEFIKEFMAQNELLKDYYKEYPPEFLIRETDIRDSMPNGKGIIEKKETDRYGRTYEGQFMGGIFQRKQIED